MTTTLISNKKSTYGSPYAYYTMTASAVRTGETQAMVTVKCTGHLAYSDSLLGTGRVLNCGVNCGTWKTATLKSSSSSWSGTGSHSKTWSFYVSVGSSDTSIAISQVRVRREDSYSKAAQLDATSVNKTLSIDAWSSATIPGISGDTLEQSITITAEQGDYTHDLSYSFEGGLRSGGWSGISGTKTIDTIGWSNSIPNDADGELVVNCKTYDGDTLVGEASVSKTLKVPTYTPDSPELTITTSTEGLYLQNLSVITATGSGAASQYGATISQYLYCTDTSVSEPAWETSLARTFDSDATIYCKAVDSREIESGVVSQNIDIQPYSAPQVTIARAYISGSQLALDVNCEVSLASTLKVFYREIGSSDNYASWCSDISVSASGTITALHTVQGGESTTDVFDYKVELADNYYTATDQYTQGQVCISRHSGGDGVTFGADATESGFNCEWDANFNGAVDLGDDCLVIEQYQFAGTSVGAKNYASGDIPITKEGYYPICICEVFPNTRYYICNFYLDNKQAGSCNVYYFICNWDSSAHDNASVDYKILWRKIL